MLTSAAVAAAEPEREESEGAERKESEGAAG